MAVASVSKTEEVGSNPAVPANFNLKLTFENWMFLELDGELNPVRLMFQRQPWPRGEISIVLPSVGTCSSIWIRKPTSSRVR